jgi:hypothetical protein
MIQTVVWEALIETKQCTATVQGVFPGILSDLHCVFYIPCKHLSISSLGEALKIRALVLIPYYISDTFLQYRVSLNVYVPIFNDAFHTAYMMSRAGDAGNLSFSTHITPLCRLVGSDLSSAPSQPRHCISESSAKGPSFSSTEFFLVTSRQGWFSPNSHYKRDGKGGKCFPMSDIESPLSKKATDVNEVPTSYNTNVSYRNHTPGRLPSRIIDFNHFAVCGNWLLPISIDISFCRLLSIIMKHNFFFLWRCAWLSWWPFIWRARVWW